MTRDDIIRMAREAGLHSAVLLHIYDGREAALTDSERDELRKLERFFKLAYEAGAAAEREACARLCDELAERDKLSNYYRIAANAIRARGQQQADDHDGNPSF